MPRPIDKNLIGYRTTGHSTDVERGRLRFFATATGQADPVYTDVEAAKEAGHRDLPVPPTFLFCLNMETPNPSELLDEIGVNPATILHAEQSFDYHAMAYAGDRLTFSTEVSDVYEKKGGALTFIVRTTTVTRDDEPIAHLNSSLVIRRKVTA